MNSDSDDFEAPGCNDKELKYYKKPTTDESTDSS
jgi:hypothetical protein